MSKMFAGAVALGSLLLTGVVPATAGLRAPIPASQVDVRFAADLQLAAVGDDRREYKERLREEVREWREKMHKLGDRAEAKAHRISVATRAKLNRAWSKTEAEAHRLERASARGWDKAKNSYERAKENLRTTWHNAFPEDE